MKDLLKAIENEGQTPCKKFACGQFQRCADERLACFAFGYFVETGRTVHPHIFPVPNSSGDDRLVNVGEVHPTRTWFDDIENDRIGENEWDRKRADKARQETEAAVDEAGQISLRNWFAVSMERAEKTLRRHAESAE